ncbi:MAG TPA: sulfatase-like hydrolase/transferase, partial [Longimicrobium sp.]|nr:sulfatase-like hydrolase/transferase [Longimicrobium sp.]
DPRYATGVGGAVDFLETWSTQGDVKKPFFLVVSLVNPHDVHVFVQGYADVGYGDEFRELDICLPGNRDDTLEHKPRAQRLFRTTFDRQNPFHPDKGITEEGYAKFYAFLTKLADERTCDVLDALDRLSLTDSTLIVRMGDHGEMAMSHGLREKMYNAYEETINVPLVFSNPVVFPEPVLTDAYASLVDLLPTLASIAGAERPAGIAGTDLVPVLSGEQPSVQDAVLWAYDDSAGVQASVAANHIRAMRTGNAMYAVYFSENEPDVPIEFELYDLSTDAGELNNLLNPLQVPVEEWQALHDQLTCLLEERGGGLPPGVDWPVKVDASLLDLPPLTIPLEEVTIGWMVPVVGK